MRRLLVFLVVMLAFSACSRPLSYEYFIKDVDAQAGMYNFDLDMSDSTTVYDIYLYTRVDRGKIAEKKNSGQIKLDIWWVAPSQSVYDETVYMDMGDYRGVKQLYRKGIVPSENGTWRLCIKPDNVPVSFRGLGVICDQNGTR